MSGYDLYPELQKKIEDLNKAVANLKTQGMTYAQAERDYKVAFAKKLLIERDKKVPVTIIGDICRGAKDIADLRFNRDAAEVTYKSALEAINAYKLQIRIIENQLQREWGNAK